MARQDVKIRREGGYEFVFSTTADRANSVPLEGKRVSGVIYVTVQPTTQVSSVTFTRSPNEGSFRTDEATPFDFVGDSGGSALPLVLADYWPGGGSVTFNAVVTGSDSTTHTITTTFTVLPAVTPNPPDDEVADPAAIPVVASIPMPTVSTSGASRTVTPATIAVPASVETPSAGTGDYKLAVALLSGSNPTPSSGGTGAREKVEALEADIGRRILYSTANYGDNLKSFTTLSVTTGASNSITLTGHGLATRDVVHSSSGGGGIAANKLYWVVPSSVNAFVLSETKGGPAVTLTAGVPVTLLKHNFIASAMNEASALRTEWAIRPDVTHANIFHAYQTPQGPAVSNGGGQSPIPYFRQRRRVEIAAGEWDTQYNQFFNSLHRTKTGASYNATTGVVTDSGHGQKVGERIIVTAQATTTAFTTSTEGSPTYYYVLTVPSTSTYTLTTTPPWDWDTENEVAVTGGGNGTINTIWRFSVIFRVGHEGDLAYPGGYPDGRLWDSSQGVAAMTASDETQCRQMWEHICDLIHDHGFTCEWSGNGAQFDKLKNAFRMTNYAATFPGDERKSWEYGLPGSTHTGSPNYTMTYTNVSDYLDGIVQDVYYGIARGKTPATWLDTTSGIIDQLRSAASTCGIYWAIGELGIWYMTSAVGGITYSGSGVFTKTNHGLANNQEIRVGWNGTTPTGLAKTSNDRWWVVDVTPNTFGLASSQGGTAHPFAGSGHTNISLARWAGIGDTTVGSAGTHSSKGFIDGIWDKAAADGYGTTSGKCRYISYFWVGDTSITPGFNPTNMELYAPNAWAQIYGNGGSTHRLNI